MSNKLTKLPFSCTESPEKNDLVCLCTPSYNTDVQFNDGHVESVKFAVRYKIVVTSPSIEVYIPDVMFLILL